MEPQQNSEGKNTGPSRLYAGMFDLARGASASIDSAALFAAAIFFDEIIAPDAYFISRGPLLTHFTKLAAAAETKPTAFSEDPVLGLMRIGCIVQQSRRDTDGFIDFFNRPSHGIGSGQFLEARDEATSRTLGQLEKWYAAHDSQIRVQTWPAHMSNATSDRFWQLMNSSFNDSGSPLFIKKLDTWRWKSNDNDVRDVVCALRKSVEDSTEHNRYRRGIVEQVLFRQLGIEGADPKQLTYDQFWNVDPTNPRAWAVREIARHVSTIYELFQAHEFGADIQLFEHYEEQIALQRDLTSPRSSFVPNKEIDIAHPLRHKKVVLCSLAEEINFQKLTVQDVEHIRSGLRWAGIDDVGANLRATVRHLRRLPNPEAVNDLRDVIYNQLLPAMRRDPVLKHKIRDVDPHSHKVFANIMLSKIMPTVFSFSVTVGVTKMIPITTLWIAANWAHSLLANLMADNIALVGLDNLSTATRSIGLLADPTNFARKSRERSLRLISTKVNNYIGRNDTALGKSK